MGRPGLITERGMRWRDRALVGDTVEVWLTSAITDTC